MDAHALVFRVLRLSPASLELDEGLRFNLDEDMGPQGGPCSPPSHPFAGRVHAADPKLGLTPLLTLPQTFGSVYLGQEFRACVSVCNQTQQPVTLVGAKVELQAERSSAVLFDSTSSPLPALAAGARLDLPVRHDVKELGPHTLTCSSVYTAPDGERRYLPQVFRFTTANPMVVRTKHRMAGEAVLLEATLENLTKAPMLLDSVAFQAQPPFQALQIGGHSAPTFEEEGEAAGPGGASSSAGGGGGGPLAGYLASLPLLPPGGGAHSFLFRLEKAAQPTGGGSSGREGSGGVEARAMGKLDIRWRGPMGEPARIQTQLITLPPRAQRDLSLAVVRLPQRLALEQPATAEVRITNHIARRVGPLKLSYVPATAEGGGAGGAELPVVGPQSVVVAELPPHGEVAVALTLLPRAVGPAVVAGLVLSDERDGVVLDQLQPPVEAFVSSQ